MDTGTRGFARGDIRVSDAERDQAVTELSEHFQTGRLTQDEFDDRTGRALQARTGADLNGLFSDLPPRRAMVPPQAAFAEPDPVFAPGGPPRPNFLPLARVIIAFIVAAIIAGGLFGGHGYHHGGGIGFLVPVVILGLVMLRLRRRRF
ncbi:MAG: DUF1707 SHOCT-like domain-containing protein [Trebonia sp.]